MPRTVEPGEGPAIDLPEMLSALADTVVDVRDEDGFASLGPLLARLARNRTFLADLAIRELETRYAGQRANGYGAQVLMLHPPDGRFVVRANFWPARNDAVVRASGTAPFFYDMPHDHNFSFLTAGYLGPGYWSDYYELDGRRDLLPGDRAGLRFAERSRLSEGRVLLYRAHRDMHVQLPPDAFSVSLNILGYDPAQSWRSQYRFDVAADRVAEALTVTPAEVLATLAVQFGGDNGIGLAHDMMRCHPSARMRRTALDALASAETGPEARADLFARAADDPVLGAHARARLERLHIGA